MAGSRILMPLSWISIFCESDLLRSLMRFMEGEGERTPELGRGEHSVVICLAILMRAKALQCSEGVRYQG
jgi:hypothetical protein